MIIPLSFKNKHDTPFPYLLSAEADPKYDAKEEEERRAFSQNQFSPHLNICKHIIILVSSSDAKSFQNADPLLWTDT